ncbi:hypothetical protein GBAR_LOCUS1342 [Geodia barretti]|uniref:Uncharacterized protein n=1 Tax=Geodia barretti TaxID=519541 RepID=A0AA35W2M4_GEOBA|nr:hypothetical protein GBAR_LOCUS1342 [Geodia barretti]
MTDVFPVVSAPHGDVCLVLPSLPCLTSPPIEESSQLSHQKWRTSPTSVLCRTNSSTDTSPRFPTLIQCREEAL